MKLRNIYLIAALIIISCNQESNKSNNHLLKQDNLTEPILFRSSLNLNNEIDFSPALTSNLNEMYFVLSDATFQTYEIKKYVINEDSIYDVWFSKRSKDYSPFISSDDKYLLFASYRSLHDPEKLNDHPDLWYSERGPTGWSKPKSFGDSINTEFGEGFVSMAKNGNLYFESNRPGGFGDWDIYVAEKVNGWYKKPKNLGANINSELYESDAFIAPDESYIIFGSYNREEGYGSSDLYISFRQENGEFGNPVNLGGVINTKYLEHNPHISGDGKFFFFSSDKPRNDSDTYQMANFDIYYLSADFINDLRSNQ